MTFEQTTLVVFIRHSLSLTLQSELLADKGYSGSSSSEHNVFLGQHLYDTTLRRGKMSQHSNDLALSLVYTKNL